MEILKIENLSFTYPLCSSPALNDIYVSVKKGDFVVICGATGSGKSTLLHMLKPELTPLGEKRGRIFYDGTDIEVIGIRSSASCIGYVAQRPEQQLVTDKVWHELAFGLENMHTPQNIIRRRVAEMCSFFGIEDWFDKNISELSGGQKQLLNLAAVMVMQPQILILDEPTAQLDPIAAGDFIATLQKLNRELSLTIIAVEHRLEDIIPVCDKLIVLDKGKILSCGEPRAVIERLRYFPELLCGMPAASRLYNRFNINAVCPLTVREGRLFIEENFGNIRRSLTSGEYLHDSTPALEFHDVWFRYSRDSRDVLCGTELTVFKNEILCILGGNGSGKTTALGAAAGINRIYSGYIKVFGRSLTKYKGSELYRGCLAYLPQDVQTVFLKNTVREELADAGAEISELPYDLTPLLDKHPYDISGGEQQLVALAKVLALKPRLLLLDEPTKGLDANAKAGIVQILKKLKSLGITVLTVTHDVEFAALCADRCALFFRGEITSVDIPSVFFAENSFYTTAANRMTRNYYDNAVTVDDAEKLCRLNTHSDNSEERSL